MTWHCWAQSDTVNAFLALMPIWSYSRRPSLWQDGEVPRDTEFARVRQYMIRRCLYAAALIMNVQVGRAVGQVWLGHALLMQHRPSQCHLSAVLAHECKAAQLLAAQCRGCFQCPCLLVITLLLVCHLQMPEHNRDPDSILHLLDDWTDIQLEGFFRWVDVVLLQVGRRA